MCNFERRLVRMTGLICLTVCGCLGLGQTTLPNSGLLPPRPPAPAFTETVADLRISADEVPADPVPVGPAPAKRMPPATDIPLVPVPLPPLKGDRPQPPPTAVPTAPGPRANPLAAPPPPMPMPTPRQLFQQAAESFARYDSYIARLTRREPAKGKNDDQILSFAFRKDPWSVRFKWLAGDGIGREVLYVKGRNENKIFTLLAAGDIPLVPAGKRIGMPVDSIMVKAASRYPITHAGIGAMINRVGEALDACERGNFRLGKITVLGLQQRPDYDGPLVMAEHTLPPGADLDAPQGGRRLYGFSPDNHLPVLSVLQDQHGQELDYYRFDRLLLGLKLDDADFDPDQMGVRTDEVPENSVSR